MAHSRRKRSPPLRKSLSVLWTTKPHGSELSQETIILQPNKDYYYSCYLCAFPYSQCQQQQYHGFRKRLSSGVNGHTSGGSMRVFLQDSGAFRDNLQITKGSAIISSLVADHHLLCNAIVQTLNENSFLACTMINSGSQSSLISEDYISRHQLTSTPLRPAIPIRGLDSKPPSKGSISHIATCKVKIGDHSELKTFGIVKMPWDLLLGVNWLQTHNPEINWKANSLCFSCCDSGHLGSQFTTLASTLVPGPANAINSDSINIAILSAH